jgi:hypothetical protein
VAEGYRTVGMEHWRPTMAAARAQGQQGQRRGRGPATLRLSAHAAWQQARARLAARHGQTIRTEQEIGSLLPVLAPAGTRYLVLP